MKKPMITLVIASVVALFFVLAFQPASGQPNLQTILGNHMKFLNPDKSAEHLPPVVTVDKVIPVGSDYVAFNPNHGNAKVITKLEHNDNLRK